MQVEYLKCISCVSVLLCLLNAFVVEKDKKALFLAFLGRSHFVMFYSHAYFARVIM